jgi:hypothetical protein
MVASGRLTGQLHVSRHHGLVAPAQLRKPITELKGNVCVTHNFDGTARDNVRGRGRPPGLFTRPQQPRAAAATGQGVRTIVATMALFAASVA